MIKKRVLSVSAAVMLGMTALTSPPVVAQTVEDTVTEAQATYAETTYPDVEWEQAENGNLYSIPKNGDRSLNCSVDWNAAAILDHRLDDHSNNGFTMKVFDESHAGQSRGYASLQHWGTSETSTVAFWRPVVAFDADVNDAAVVLTVPAADYSVSDASDWFLNRYLPADVPDNPYDTPATVLDTDIQTAGDTTTITFRLGDVKAGTGFGASLNGDIGQTGVTGSMRITGNFVRGSETGVEDCQFTFGYDDSFTHPGVEVEVNQTGEFQVPENTSYEVIQDNGQPKVTDADGQVYPGWIVEVDRYTGRLSITPPENTDPNKKYFAHVEATTPDGISQETTAGVQVAAEVQRYEIRDDNHLWALINGEWVDLGEVVGPAGEDGAPGESVTIVNQYIDDNGNTVIEFSDGTAVTVNKGECAACSGSSMGGSSDSEDDTEGSSLPAGSSNGSSDARCVQAAATVGIPLLALIPIGLATQVNIPGLSPLVADAQAQLQSINTDLQQQSGIYDDETARLIAQINAELEKNGGAIGQAVGAAAVIAIGGLVGKYLYDNCVPRA